MNAIKLKRFVKQQNPISNGVAYLKHCRKGVHESDRSGYFCKRCHEQMYSFPEWNVVVTSYKQEQFIVEAENPISAEFLVLSKNINFLKVGNKTIVTEIGNIDNTCELIMNIERFNQIFDEYERSNLHQYDANDEKRKKILNKMPVYCILMLFIYLFVSQSVAGFLGIICTAVFITILISDCYLVDQRYKEKDEMRGK